MYMDSLDSTADFGEMLRMPEDSLLALVREQARLHAAQAGSAPLRGRRAATVTSPVVPECWIPAMLAYLNHAEVQRAIHVRPDKRPSHWTPCNMWLPWYDFNYESVVPLYRKWAAEGKYEILVYSGDTDTTVNFLGTNAWLATLGLKKTVDWEPWRGSDGQIAGYRSEYATAGKPIAFLSIKGAGHMVPKDRPLHALDMIERYLAGAGYDTVAQPRGTGPGGPMEPPPLCGE